MKAELLWATPMPTQAIEYAARVCYDSHDKTKEGSAGKLVRACINKGHYSITEHACASFHITGVTRALLAQITRHRYLSFCVRSQRYCKEDRFDFKMPAYPDTSDGCHTEVVFSRAMAHAQSHYDELIAHGMKPEDARGVLPNACHTEFIVTANFRAWYEFLQKRTDRAAQGEIRELSQLIKKELSKISPEVFGVC